ncbi:MAG: hypothetical protein DCC75_11795 [Proteobacteria bacterium]|nr:MAG: hypothetical protein DCC75_11795 [Pseudomonadota bacterium]
MEKIWILVAERAGAKIYERSSKIAPLKLIKDIPHPDGRLKNIDLASDKHGQGSQTGRTDLTAFESHDSPKEHLTKQYAKSLIDELQHAQRTNQCDGFVLEAEPGLLGVLASSLDDQGKKLLRARIDKDLTKLVVEDLKSEIERAM